MAGLFIIVVALLAGGVFVLFDKFYKERSRIEIMELGKVFILFGGFLSLLLIQAGLFLELSVIIGLLFIFLGLFISVISFFRN